MYIKIHIIASTTRFTIANKSSGASKMLPKIGGRGEYYEDGG
jgi:hypothetical protein